jgi:broad specificity phosphatase PhoE
MYTIVWIRHAEKAYNNSKGPKHQPLHDPPILESENAKINTVALDLAKRFGAPDHIFTSPFLRTRETAIKMHQAVASAGYKVPENLDVDVTVEEYLGHQKPCGEIPSLGSETLKFTQTRLGETMEALYKRVNEHMSILTIPDTLFRVYHDKTDAVDNLTVWVITHGIIITTIHEQLLALAAKVPDEYKPVNISEKVVNSPESLTGLVIRGRFYHPGHTKTMVYNPFESKSQSSTPANSKPGSPYKVLPDLPPVTV